MTTTTITYADVESADREYHNLTLGVAATVSAGADHLAGLLAGTTSSADPSVRATLLLLLDKSAAADYAFERWKNLSAAWRRSL